MPPTPHRPRLQLRAANITLGLNQVPALTAGDYVEFEVRDNGSGIDPAHVGKIFDPFFTSKDVGKGMGLGLSITHQILQAHKAIVEVDSRPTEFTRFRIVFPAPSFSSEPESVLDQPA